MGPLVSILIPTNNRPELVVKAIESALSQTYKNIEVVVTDNSSSFVTGELIGAIDDPRLKYIKNDSNIGPILNWRKSLDAASGEYCILLPDDDHFINPFYVADSVSIAEKNNVDLVITNCLLGYPSRTAVAASNHIGLIDAKTFRKGFWKSYHIPTIANLFKRSTALKLDPFTSNEILYSDIDLWLKMLGVSERIYCYNKPSVYYLFHDENIVTTMTTDSLVNNSKFISTALGAETSNQTKSVMISRYISFIDSIYNVSSYSVTKRIFAANNIHSSIALYHFKTLATRNRRRIISLVRKYLKV